MKNPIFIAVLFLFPWLTNAQHTIYKRDGEKIAAFVLLVKKDSVLYKRNDDPRGPDRRTSRADISYIRYKSGRVDDFDSLVNASKKDLALVKNSSREQLLAMGKSDARKYYKCEQCGGYRVFQTILFPRRSIVRAVNRMNTFPRETKLDYPSKDLWTSDDYQEGYLREVLSIRRKKMKRAIWIGACINGLASTAFFLPAIFGDATLSIE